ncbi:MAG: chromate resistance protein [Rhodospirillales bacterium]|nr:chromate resistance protein [Rhodospirillales bacterium]
MSKAVTERLPESTPWLLLIHQLPAKPAYLRVKVWRRLQALGAVTVKNSVYALPASEQTREDFAWVLKEIGEGGGEGMICEARMVDGLSDQDVRDLFNTARDADYEVIAKGARELGERLTGETEASARADANARLVRLKAEAARVMEVDFFGADGREAVAGLLGALDAQLREETGAGDTKASDNQDSASGAGMKNRVWVTRQGVHVDRIASAWLIRRFIDPEAQFKCVAAKGYVPEPGELRFDMFEAEFTHEGDRCTFEVLCARMDLADPALVPIGEIVHDIDLKDGKFGREEASGIAHLLEGIRAAHDDEHRLLRGVAMFDDLYEYFRKGAILR